MGEIGRMGSDLRVWGTYSRLRSMSSQARSLILYPERASSARNVARASASSASALIRSSRTPGAVVGYTPLPAGRRAASEVHFRQTSAGPRSARHPHVTLVIHSLAARRVAALKIPPSTNPGGLKLGPASARPTARVIGAKGAFARTTVSAAANTACRRSSPLFLSKKFQRLC